MPETTKKDFPVIDIDREDLAHFSRILKQKKIVLIAFYKMAYHPDEMAALGRVAESGRFGGDVLFCRHRTSEEGDVARKFGVSAMAVLVFEGGESPRLLFHSGLTEKKCNWKKEETYIKLLDAARRGKLPKMKLAAVNLGGMAVFLPANPITEITADNSEMLARSIREDKVILLLLYKAKTAEVPKVYKDVFDVLAKKFEGRAEFFSLEVDSPLGRLLSAAFKEEDLPSFLILKGGKNQQLLFAYELLRAELSEAGDFFSGFIENALSEVIEIQPGNIEQLRSVFSKKQLTILLFYKADCPHCHKANRALNGLAVEFKGKVIFCRHRTSDNGEVAAKLDIPAMPLVMVFKWDKNGNHPKAVYYTVGFSAEKHTEKEYRKQIEEALRGEEQRMELKEIRLKDLLTLSVPKDFGEWSKKERIKTGRLTEVVPETAAKFTIAMTEDKVLALLLYKAKTAEVPQRGVFDKLAKKFEENVHFFSVEADSQIGKLFSSKFEEGNFPVLLLLKGGIPPQIISYYKILKIDPSDAEYQFTLLLERALSPLIEIPQENLDYFKNILGQEGRIILIEFYHPDCKQAHKELKILGEIAALERFRNKLMFYRHDTRLKKDVAKIFGVADDKPTTVIFRGGKHPVALFYSVELKEKDFYVQLLDNALDGKAMRMGRREVKVAGITVSVPERCDKYTKFELLAAGR